MVALSPRLSAAVRRAMRPLLTHTYTRTTPNSVPVLDEFDQPTYDAWEQPIMEDGSATSGLACVYLSSRRLVVREAGPVLLDVPTLTVLHSDSLAVGDRVTSVIDQDGTVLVTSAVVEAFDPSAEGGASALKVAVLRSAEAVA